MRIEGRGAEGDQDHFLFEGLSRGSQSFRIMFEAPEDIGQFHAAGGVVMWRDGPFRWSGWEGREAGRLQLGRREGSVAELAFDTGRRFAGGLIHLALHFTHGRDVSDVVSLPQEPRIVGGATRLGLLIRVVVTPLPAGAALLLTSVAAGAGLRLRRSKG